MERDNAVLQDVVENQVIGIITLSIDEKGGVVSSIFQAAESPEQRTALADEVESIARLLRSG